MRIAILAIVFCCGVLPAIANEEAEKCFVLCRPELKIEPTFTWENWIGRPRVAQIDTEANIVVKTLRRERVFETVVALEVPTAIPRVTFTC